MAITIQTPHIKTNKYIGTKKEVSDAKKIIKPTVPVKKKK